MIIVGASKRLRRKKIPMILNQVGLTARAKAYPSQLSGGEKQRVAIARAIINNPSILVADEPTGNLDPETAREIMQLLDDINKNGTTVIVATHAKDIVDAMKNILMFETGNRVALVSHSTALTCLLSAWCEIGHNYDDEIILSYGDETIVDGHWTAPMVYKVVFDGTPDLLTNEVLTMIYKGDSFLKGSEK